MPDLILHLGDEGRVKIIRTPFRRHTYSNVDGKKWLVRPCDPHKDFHPHNNSNEHNTVTYHWKYGK